MKKLITLDLVLPVLASRLIREDKTCSMGIGVELSGITNVREHIPGLNK